MYIMVVVTISASTEWKTALETASKTTIHHSPLGDWFLKDLTVGSNNMELVFFHGGEGKIPAASSTQYIIDRWKPELLINLGTCGGFEGKIDKGTIILVEKTVVYDIKDLMPVSHSVKQECTTVMDLSWMKKPYPQNVIKTNMLSADRDLDPRDIRKLSEEYDAVAADWESGSIAYVAQKNCTRCIILRGVSDLVNSSGGEAYVSDNTYKKETIIIVRKLLKYLPSWLAAAI
jgi:adenosylhomocysteine nucleosidase